MRIRSIFLLLWVATCLQSCGLFGIRLNLHNPKQPGRVPNFSNEQILLGEMTELRNGYDVHYYDLSIDFDPEKEKLTGAVYIFATATQDLNRLQLDLHPNFEITRLSLGDDGPELPYTRKERAVFVDITQLKGSQFVLYVDYTGQPKKAKKAPWKGGFVWEKDEDGNPWVGVACESDGASLWWPLKDHTADEPDSIRLHYTVPKGLIAVGNGQLENSSEMGDRVTYDWYVSYPINTYNVTVYIGKYKKLTQDYTGIDGEEMTLIHYVLGPNYETAKRHFQQVPDILRNFEQQFGSYPWYRDGFKLVESPYAGMEHQTAIAYGNGYENDLNANTDYIILHETAHEWWGNSVTAEDLADVWLQEGFATYAEALYLEDMLGEDAYDSHLFLYRLTIKNKYPVVGVRDRRWFHFRKNQDVYTKGAWILHTFIKGL
ncbi:MAG: M1 family metallopeptidase [Bacteroidota bacterium]